MSGFLFWGSSWASERNWISLPLPEFKKNRVRNHWGVIFIRECQVPPAQEHRCRWYDVSKSPCSGSTGLSHPEVGEWAGPTLTTTLSQHGRAPTAHNLGEPSSRHEHPTRAPHLQSGRLTSSMQGSECGPAPAITLYGLGHQHKSHPEPTQRCPATLDRPHAEGQKPGRSSFLAGPTPCRPVEWSHPSDRWPGLQRESPPQNLEWIKQLLSEATGVWGRVPHSRPPGI